MLPGGYTLGGDKGVAYGVVSGVYILGGVIGESCCGRDLFVGGIGCKGAEMLNILEICFKASVWLFPGVVSDIVWVGLRRAYLRSTTA